MKKKESSQNSGVRRQNLASWSLGLLLLSSLIIQSSSVAAVTYYVDGWLGSSSNDGLAATALYNGHGPVRNITTAIALSTAGDTIQVAPGFYQETHWLPNGQNLVLPTVGTAYISDTDPLQTDRDGDGIPDAFEAKYASYGLNPFNASDAGQTSSLPWDTRTNNLAAYQASQVLPTIAATITPTPNAAGWNNSNVMVHFQPNSTGSGIAWVTSDITVTGSTNDCEVTGWAMDNAGYMVSTSVILNIDQTPPVITLDPGVGQTLDQSHPLLLIQYADTDTNIPPVLMSSGIDLPTLQSTLDGVDVTTNFYTFANGAVGIGSNLVAGTHTWNATIADIAGHVTSTSVTFTATGAMNPNAPVISNLDLGDTGVTVMPDIPEVWVQGQLSDTNATVSASVNGGESIPMNKRGNIFGSLLPLDVGTNVIVMVAVDNSGQNLSSKLILVERSNRYQVAITNLLFGTFANGVANHMAGTISLKKNAGAPEDMNRVLGAAANRVKTHSASIPEETALVSVTVKVGGISYAATVIDLGDGMGTFTTIEPVPAPCDAVAVMLDMAWEDLTENEIPLGLWEGYEILERQTTGSEVRYWNLYHTTSTCGWNPCPGGWQVSWDGSPSTQAWATAFISPCMQVGDNSSEHTAAADAGSQCLASANPSGIVWNESEVGDTTSAVTQPARGLAFGTQTWQEDFTVWGWDGCGDVEDSVSGVNSNEDGTLTFVRPLGLSVGQPLIFTLEGLTYATVGDATVDVSQVRFKLSGDWHDPVAVTNNAAGGWDVSYVLVVGTDLLGTNTIGQGNFIWPSSSSNYTESGCVDNPCPYGPPYQWNETFTTHRLSFTGFHNGPPTCGPDVTELVETILAQVQEQWIGWSTNQRCVACESLHDTTTAGGAWDISPLDAIGLNSYPYNTSIRGTPAGAPYYFDQTVTFNKHCYLGGAVNYALWGKMNKLCSSLNPVTFSLAATVDIESLRKFWLFIQSPSIGGVLAANQAAGFTVYGYSGWNPSFPMFASVKPTNSISAGSWLWVPNYPPSTAAPSVANWCNCGKPPF